MQLKYNKRFLKKQTNRNGNRHQAIFLVCILVRTFIFDIYLGKDENLLAS